MIIPLNVEEESEEESEDDNRHDISHYRDIVSEDLLNSLKISEGLSATRTRPPGRPALTAYLDNENVWTIGWGHADTSGREPIPSRGMQIGEQRAEEILEDDIQHFREAVADSDIYRDSSDNDREARLTQHEFDALVSASFNAGVAGIGNHRDGTNGNRSIGRQILDGVHLNPDSDEYADFQNLFINARIGNNDGVRNRRQREWDMFSEENYHLTDDIELPED